VFVTTFVITATGNRLQQLVAASVMKLSEQLGNGCGIVPLTSMFAGRGASFWDFI